MAQLGPARRAAVVTGLVQSGRGAERALVSEQFRVREKDGEIERHLTQPGKRRERARVRVFVSAAIT